MLNFKCDLVTTTFIAAGVIRDIRRQYFRAGLSMREAELVIRNRLSGLPASDRRSAEFECSEMGAMRREQRIGRRKL